MKPVRSILFFILELITGTAAGISGAYLVTPKQPKYDLNLSIIIFFLYFSLFALAGIGIPGFFHNRMNGGDFRAFLFRLGKAISGILIGFLIAAVVSGLTFNHLPYSISSVYIPILIPVFFGVIGFNKA